MKKRDIILFSIILISIVEIALATADVTAPDLNFISPTAEDNANINSDYTLLNVSIAEENLDDIIFSWDGTDHTAYNDSLVFFMNLDNNALISETSVSAADNSNYENNGIIHGASWTADGKYGSALEFNGGGDYVDCGNDNSLDITDAITISAWIKRDDLNNEDEILSKRQSGQVPYRFKISDGDRLYFRCYSNSTEGEILIVDAGTATPLSNYASSGDVSTLNNAWLSFDGIDDYVEVADADELSVSNTGKFTVSFWIKPATSEFEGSSASGYREILGKGSSGEHEYLVRFFNSSVSGANTILFILQSLAGSSHGTTRSSKINTNEWNLVTATVDATQVCIYSNGDKDDCDTYSIPIGSGTAPLRMGTKRKTTKDWFNGSMDDIKIWNKTL
ncbi:MAG: hypothetical protein KAI51_00360, partial [Candidatus Aenigmarchaeota archaeon]|nr:hypothetical protein [Candidatus Aenigmarchaeota archaeon]